MGEPLRVNVGALGAVGVKTSMKGSKEAGALSTGFADVAGDVAGLATQMALMQAQARRDGSSKRLSGQIENFGGALVAAASAVENSDDASARLIDSVRAV